MTKSADQINAAVMRIAGISRSVFAYKGELTESEKINQGVYGLDLPAGHEMPPTKAKGNVDDSPDYDNEEDEIKGVHPGKGEKMEACDDDEQEEAISRAEKDRRFQLRLKAHADTPNPPNNFTRTNADDIAAWKQEPEGEDYVKRMLRATTRDIPKVPNSDPLRSRHGVGGRGRSAYDIQRQFDLPAPKLPKDPELTQSHQFEDSFQQATGCPLNEWRRLSGLGEDQSGQVPTVGAHKQNKMKGGLAGLEGDTVQPIDPVEGPGGDEYVGDDEEMTFDDAIALLKKEGIDVDAMWCDFLESRGLTVALFNQLIDEAIQGGDSEEMDALLAVENIFYREIPRLLPEWNHSDGYSAHPTPGGIVGGAVSKAAGAVTGVAGRIGRALSALAGKRQADAPVSYPSHNRQAFAPMDRMGAPKTAGEMPSADATTPKAAATDVPDVEPAGTASPAKDPTKVPASAPSAEDTDEEWTFEADDDGTGNPAMPWMNQASESVMGRLAGKYLAEAKAELGSGARFKQVEKSVAKSKKVKDPAAVAAAIGRKKLGKARFQALAAAGRRKA